jgi:predicted amidophosphoribosyltransferase
VQLQQLLQFLFPPQCGGCDAPGSGMCERCLPHAPTSVSQLPTLRVATLAPYDGNLRRAVLALKNGRRDVAQAFALRLCECVEKGDVLVPVPTTRARRRQRGFDGCELMAASILKNVPVTVLAHLRQITGDRQRGRGRDARLSARGRFAWTAERIDGVRVRLLDDVVTTGATLEDCAAALRDAGAIVDDAIAVARA